MNLSRRIATSCILLLLLTCCSGTAAEPDDKIRIDGLKGWRGERIQLPPVFARDLKIKGVEEIRFAPGMFNPAAKDFFSYVIVFRLDDQPELSAETLKRELLTYYVGLAKAVSQGAIETDGFSIDVAPEKLPGGKVKRDYLATLEWVEPFATKKPQTLRIETRVWAGEKSRTWAFMCVSPNDTHDSIWKTMRSVRDGFFKDNPPPTDRTGC